MDNSSKLPKLTLKLGDAKKKELVKVFSKISAKQEADINPVANKDVEVKQKIEANQDKEKIKSGPDQQKKPSSKSAKNKNSIMEHQEYIDILKYLQKNYPKCFAVAEIRPLEIGIREKIFVIEGGGFSRGKIRKFLKVYTRTKKYKQSLVLGAARVNLAGEETSKILESEIVKRMVTKDDKSNQKP